MFGHGISIHRVDQIYYISELLCEQRSTAGSPKTSGRIISTDDYEIFCWFVDWTIDRFSFWDYVIRRIFVGKRN